VVSSRLPGIAKTCDVSIYSTARMITPHDKMVEDRRSKIIEM